jgi:hypothetical protein
MHSGSCCRLASAHSGSTSSAASTAARSMPETVLMTCVLAAAWRSMCAATVQGRTRSPNQWQTRQTTQNGRTSGGHERVK